MAGEEQPVAGDAVVRPFVVGAEILDRRLDLDDPDRPVGPEPHHVGPPPGRQRQLGHHGETAIAQQPADAAADRAGVLGLAAIHGWRDVGEVGREQHTYVTQNSG